MNGVAACKNFFFPVFIFRLNCQRLAPVNLARTGSGSVLRRATFTLLVFSYPLTKVLKSGSRPSSE